MADNKHDKPKSKNASFIDSAELFESLFRKELDALSSDGNRKRAAKKGGRTSGVKKSEPSLRVKTASRKNTASQHATGKRKSVKHYPVSRAKVDTPSEVLPKKRTMLRKAVKEKAAPNLKDNKQEEIILEDVNKIGETEGSEMGFGGKVAQNLEKLKIALLCMVLVVAVGFIINSLGLVNFGRRLGLSEPSEKGRMKALVANRPPAKKPEKTTSQIRRSIVQKPPETTTPFSKPGATQRPSKTVLATRPPVNTQRSARRHAPTQEPVVAQEHTTATTSTPKALVAKPPLKPSPKMQKPVIATRSQETAISAQNPDVPDQQAESATIVKERPVTKTQVQPLDSTKEPTVVKDPPHTSAPRIHHSAVKESPGSADPTRKEAALGKQEIPPEVNNLSYPYSVYLGSYKTRGTAAKAVSDYRRKGLSPYWVKIDLAQKGIWYRIFVGRFETRDNAEAFIREKGLSDAEVMKTKDIVHRIAYSATDDKLKKGDSEKKEPLSAANVSSYPYSIYLGSYQSQELADKAISGYRKKGLSPYWVKIDLGEKGVWYRIFSEYFEKRRQANEFIAKNQIAGAKSRHTKYANLIGTFASLQKLDTDKLRLSKLGYCPYVVHGHNGQFRLYVGAFYQKARAQRQAAELESKGIHSQMVER
jgi:cell division septation protein DedD